MSVTMIKEEGVTMFTVASNPKSKWPLLCQILGRLCYSPLCSVSLGLRKIQGSSQSALGVMQIMAGLLNLGLGAVIIKTSDSWLKFSRAPFWLGGVFLVVGFMCILAERFPSQCLVGISVLMNVVGAALAVTGIGLYAKDLASGDKIYWDCDYYTTTRPPIERYQYLEKCRDIKWIAMTLLNSLDMVLIVLSVLQLCVTLSSAVLGVKALREDGQEEDKGQEPELYSPLLEVTTHATAQAEVTTHATAQAEVTTQATAQAEVTTHATA